MVAKEGKATNQLPALTIIHFCIENWECIANSGKQPKSTRKHNSVDQTWDKTFGFLNPARMRAREREWKWGEVTTDIRIVQLEQHHKTDGNSRKVPSAVRSPAEVKWRQSETDGETEETMERPFSSSSPNLINVKTQKRFNGCISLGHPRFNTSKTLRFTHFFPPLHHYYR